MEVAAAVLAGLLFVAWLVATAVGWRALRADRRARGDMRWKTLSRPMRAFVVVCVLVGCVAGVLVAIEVDDGRDQRQELVR